MPVSLQLYIRYTIHQILQRMPKEPMCTLARPKAEWKNNFGRADSQNRNKMTALSVTKTRKK